MVFLKIHVENVIWKAIPLEMFGEHQGVRLFDSNNQLLASALVQQSLGDAAKSYQEDFLVRESIATQSSFLQPAFVPYPSMKWNVPPAGASLSGPLRSNFAIPLAHRHLPSTTSTPELPIVAVPFSVVQMPSLKLAAEETLYVWDAGTSGNFFGPLKKIKEPNSMVEYRLKNLHDLAHELEKAYSTQTNPPFYIPDAELNWDIMELSCGKKTVSLLLIDCGNTIEVEIQTILAPNKSLTGFCHPPYGIHCKLEEDVTLHSSKWKHFIVGEWIRVKIRRCDNGVYSVAFTSDGCNRNIVAKIRNAVLGQKATEHVETKKNPEESAVLNIGGENSDYDPIQ
ncbi:hypothetical protein DAPPUDRAFT_119089 [Daphnia pulex]|uniref:Tudor domain-containing protein n=1 Tax=Daphnia pulex TaxID=6669 RepID=E9HXD9_DAPPU|nr:hypothetical protein DAPPUDRAFT_119089 [Daphnia pulex]|eukprot:EFX63588.1 hypothetical protein DAPPUDRAFT_119089 [Daphnia pulex]